MKITEAELASALGSMILPADSGVMLSQPLPPGQPGYDLPPPPSGFLVYGGGKIAAAVFQVVRDLRAEAARWVTGALYQSETTGTVITGPDAGKQATTLSVYRREESGWFAYGCNEHIPDGRVDTQHFRRLVPEETS